MVEDLLDSHNDRLGKRQCLVRSMRACLVESAPGRLEGDSFSGNMDNKQGVAHLVSQKNAELGHGLARAQRNHLNPDRSQRVSASALPSRQALFTTLHSSKQAATTNGLPYVLLKE